MAQVGARWTAIGIALLVASCASVGPATIPRDRFDYSSAIVESWKRQMLLNIVRLRYGDPPVFLDVASVINQYTLESLVSATGANATVLSGESIYGVGANVRFADRPTITYHPLTGEKFTRELLTPIPPVALMSLIQAGYPAAFIFRIAVRSINGITNRSDIMLMQHPGDPEFVQLLDALGRLQQSDAVGMRIKDLDGDRHAVIFIRAEDIGQQEIEDSRTVRRLLGIPGNTLELKLVFGSVPAAPDELAILSRSLLEMMLELSADADIPPEHLTDGRATPTTEHPDTEPLMHIKVQTDRPDDAYAAVPFQDHWFWIDNTDLRSKRVMAFMMILFSLAESGGGAQAPVVTVNAGE